MTGNRLWIIGSAFVAIVILALGWFLGVSPALSSSAAANLQRAEVETQNAGLAAELAALKEQYEQIDLLTTELEGLRGEVPATSSVGDYLRELYKAAKADGVRVTAVRWAEPVAFVPAPDFEVTIDTANLAYIQLDIELAGKKSSVLKFMNRLQTGGRLYTLSDVHLEAENDSYLAQFGGAIWVLSNPDVPVGDAIAEDDGAGIDTGEEELPTPEETSTPLPTDTPLPTETPAP